MRKNKKHNNAFLWLLLAMQILVCILTVFSVYALTANISGYTTEVLEKQALLASKGKMQERVDAVINNIEREREKVLDEVSAIGEFVTQTISPARSGDITAQLQEVLPQFAGSKYGHTIGVLLYDSDTKEIKLFKDGGLEDVTARYKNLVSLVSYVKDCPYYSVTSSDNLTFYIFVPQESLDNVAKTTVYDMIHGFSYGNNGYVWVNEVLNYAGGDNYAIRRIHPNFKDTEGLYLSTNTVDENGDLPYLAELDGINSSGEIFHRYSFRDTSDGQTSEQVSYAKLYEQFNWIIATSDPLDDVFANTNEIEAHNWQVFSRSFLFIIIFLLIAFSVDIVVTVFLNRRYRGIYRRRAEEDATRRNQLFDIVAQHSNCILYKYDILNGLTSPWDSKNADNDVLLHLYNRGSYSDADLEENPFVLPDSTDNVKQFFVAIHSGAQMGETKLHLSLIDGQPKWYHFKYSILPHDGQPETALISVEDITEQHEHELMSLRQTQLIEDDREGSLIFVSCDLTSDRVERLSGKILTKDDLNLRLAYSELRRNLLNLKFRYEDHVEASHYFSRENLLEQYASGTKTLKSEWKVRFNDYSIHWLSVEIVLMEDPYNNHVKALFSMRDVTEEIKEKQYALQKADYDAMTGLLHRGVGEAQIKKHLDLNDSISGILILLDLDDLKGINDTLGHDQGDKAIINVGKTLKKHFRRDDILVRAGGDEFMAFLPGAGSSVDAVEISITALLSELAEISIGANNERVIQCSVGCAVEEVGKDTFDTLFKRADKALYQVKRNGRNNYAFYSAEMEQADYEFCANTLLSKNNLKKFKLPEVQSLLNSLTIFYQLVLCANLSLSSYHVMEEVEGSILTQLPTFGSLDNFVHLLSRSIPPDDVDSFFAHLSVPALRQAYKRGAKGVRHSFRFLNQERYRRVECLVIFYENDNGELCDFAMFRWDDTDNSEAE